MLRLAATRDEVNVVEDQIGCPTSALDIADAVMAVVAAWQDDPCWNANAVYHIAGADPANWAEFARAIFAESAKLGGPAARVTDIPSKAYQTRAARPANSRLDGTKFHYAVGHRLAGWRRSLPTVLSRLLG